jgi:hypothetical protein
LYPYLRRTWYDWATVKWRNSGDDDEDEHNYLRVAARLLLFARLSDNEEDSTRPPVIVEVIHSLQHYSPNPDSLLFFAKGDKLDDHGLEVIEASAIDETAFVLPCVEKPEDDFPYTHDAATYFLVFPPRHKWSDTIWQKVE